jgi:hypothetical protein
MVIVRTSLEVRMSSPELVTISLSADLVDSIDQVDPNRSRFIAEAVTRELERRRRSQLLASLATPHPDSVQFLDAGHAEWVAGAHTDDELLLDADGGVPVRWVEGTGWIEESA